MFEDKTIVVFALSFQFDLQNLLLPVLVILYHYEEQRSAGELD